MKKLISCLLCAAIAASSSAALSTVNASAASTAPDYESYIKSTLIPKYGEADTGDINKVLQDYPDSKTKKYPEENIGWAKRDGIAGYEIADMDGDGTDDMILYLFDSDKESKENSVTIEYYTADDKGKISKNLDFNIFRKDEKFLEKTPITGEYIVSGIVERDGKKTLFVETLYQTLVVNKEDYNLDFSVFECDDKGNFVNSFKITSDDSHSSLKISERKSNGKYSDTTKKLSEKDNYSVLYDVISDLGYTAPENSADNFNSTFCHHNNAGEYYKFNNNLEDKNIPTYFGDTNEERSFYFYTGVMYGEKFLDSYNVTGFYSQADVISKYEKYKTSTLIPKYGTANTDDITATLTNIPDEKTTKYPEKNRTWAKRKGIFGYDYADMDGDLIPDLVVYLFEKECNDNALAVALYSSDLLGDIKERGYDKFFEKEEDYVKYHSTATENCYGGVIKRSGKNTVLIETFHLPYPAVDYKIDYFVYECNDKGELVKSYNISNDMQYDRLTLSTRDDWGDYSDEVIAAKDKRGIPGCMTDILEDIGYPKDGTKQYHDNFEVLGLESVVVYPTYFNTEYERKSFYFVTEVLDFHDNSAGDKLDQTIDVINLAGTFSNDEIAEKFESYVEKTLIPKYGLADTKDITATLPTDKRDPVPKTNFSWTKRKGILGWDIADMSDGIYDMAVYIFDKDGDDNKLSVEFYTSDCKGNIEKNTDFTIYEKSADYAYDYPVCIEQCTGGLVKNDSEKYCLVTEDYYIPYMCIDYLIDVGVYQWDSDKGEFVNYCRIDQDTYLGINVNTLKEDGTYSEKFVEHKKNEFYKETINYAMAELGFPSMTNESADIGKSVGGQTLGNCPTYFNTSDEKRSYYMVTYFENESTEKTNSKTIDGTNITGMFSGGSIEKAKK